jgi:hypothetical protein
MRDVLIGQTDLTVLVKIVGTDGAPETGLTEASIDLAYSRVETDNDVTISDVTPAALSALTDAHTDWGFEEVDATNAPGLYRLDIADAVFASGAWEAVVTITDASGTDFYPVDIGFRLVGQDKTAATYKADLETIKTQAVTCAAGVTVSPFVGNATAAIGVNASGHVSRVTLTDTTTTNTDMRGTDNAGTAAELAKVPKSDSNVTWNATALASIQSEANDALVAYDPPTHAELTTAVAPFAGLVLNDTTIASLGSQTSVVLTAGSADNDAYNGRIAVILDQSTAVQKAIVRITDYVGGTLTLTLAAAPVFTIAAGDRVVITSAVHETEIQADILTAVGDVPTNAELATALAAADDAVLAAIAALNNLSSAGAASAVTTALTTALTEGYRGTGATGSVRDLLYEVIAHLGESSISSTTKTLKKIDGSTTAKTYTLNDASTPTAITETT